MRKYPKVKNTKLGVEINSRIIVDPTLKPVSIDFLMVGGGGSGGYSSNYASGGGGAGGFIYLTGQSLSEGLYSIIIGSGGTIVSTTEYNGGYTTFSGLTALGGGAGQTPNVNGDNGGCGGGAGAGGSYQTYGGTGSQGYNGGDGGYGTAGVYGAGGGGGINQAGQVPQHIATNYYGGDGGDGRQFSIFGTDYYGGGGGGSGLNFPGIGGLGGGGTSASGAGVENGVANTGGGGAGYNGGGAGGYGGTGIVKIRYAANAPLMTGGVITQSGGYYIHTFLSSGTLIF